MARVLILGYGNPLRADDGLGWHAAKRLAPTLAGSDVEIITRHQLTPDLAEPVSRAERVIFIDAQAGGPPGELAIREVAPLTNAPVLLSHSLDPAALLALARQLYGTSPQAFVLSVASQSFGYSQELSPEVQSSLPELLRRARCLAAVDGNPIQRRPETEPSAVYRTGK